MKNFSSFLTEADEKQQQSPKPEPVNKRVSNDMVATFGRYNPPHKGHLRTMDFASKLADDAGADRAAVPAAAQGLQGRAPLAAQAREAVRLSAS